MKRTSSHPFRRHARQCAAAALAWAVFVSCAFGAEPLKGREYQVKAGFIYNFVKFVQWPDETDNRAGNVLRLCIVSDHSETDVFFSLSGKTVRGREIIVATADEADSLGACDIVFFSVRDADVIRERLAAAPRRGVLTIGETDGFTRMGGIINFFVANSRLRFRINIDAAARAGLKLSSQLLMSAEIVRSNPPGEAE